MSGIKNLDVLLKEMKPELLPGEFVFCTTKDNFSEEAPMTFKEKEGTTLILKKEQADKLQLQYTTIWKMITLTVHSDLEAVGLLAKVTEKLAQEEIIVNVVSAYYHDHLFVLKDKAEKALEVLKNAF